MIEPNTVVIAIGALAFTGLACAAYLNSKRESQSSAILAELPENQFVRPRTGSTITPENAAKLEAAQEAAQEAARESVRVATGARYRPPVSRKQPPRRGRTDRRSQDIVDDGFEDAALIAIVASSSYSDSSYDSSSYDSGGDCGGGCD